MKIGIVLYPTFGGSGVVATELGKALAKKGHEIHFISYNQPVRLDHFHPNIRYHEVRPFHYPLFDYQPYELALTSKLVDVVRYEGLDLLHVHYAIPHASAAYFAKQILKTHGIDVPYITTLHGTDITLVGKHPAFEPVITFSINQSDAVTVVSQSLKDDTYKHFAIENGIEVIQNFIEPGSYCHELGAEEKQRKKEIAPNGEKILCHMSNFRKVKRIEDVVQIFKKVKDKIPAKLILAGDGPERFKIEQLCEELGVCQDVTMMGNVQSASEIHCISDLFLLPSQTESFGLAALEALASGVPVISSNAGGLPEVNQDGYSGFLSNVGDVEKMAKDALHILSSEETLNKFKLQAFEHSKNFSLEKILPLYEAVYEKVTAKKIKED
ncbi:N-acetyl-alpha-D-glucosaminyl L-malate synthase BshA [Paracrocinitomix mangrovi]|uniref:N-acetyl-alpha-D-glucosaminyl L-malate synthase BshA n=1 Tax=Paracrocinitomix mangrovi TaxID=2862509 RepID=UPI001C8E7B5C|nr:N-acetyl-alpha-D-glucosaminyl L-malate synthase BshA [Paracrocinitomix mangrovi]UKN01939.1 N-acetyl-alpha-D-glucosaminyl L-malate synthase BshA [Paracrocinitomix mangrovi]